MRKRIVIGLLAVVVIGVVAFFLSQPKKGSVEWHLQEYQAARRYLFGRTISAQLDRLYWRVTKQTSPLGRKRETLLQGRRMESNMVALVGAGYFAERRFVVTNDQVDRVYRSLLQQPIFRPGDAEITWVGSAMLGEPARIVVIARPQDMSKIQDLIREADVR